MYNQRAPVRSQKFVEIDGEIDGHMCHSLNGVNDDSWLVFLHTYTREK